MNEKQELQFIRMHCQLILTNQFPTIANEINAMLINSNGITQQTLIRKIESDKIDFNVLQNKLIAIKTDIEDIIMKS